VRSFRTNARIRSLTTGTFNRVVKDRIAFRLSGAYSISPDSHKCESDCPRNRYNHTVRRRLRQRERPTEFPPDFHMGKALIGRRTAIQTAFAARNSMVFRLNLTNADIPARELFRHAQRRKTKNWEKILLEVLALQVPFRGRRFPTWASESSPVAGTI